MNAVVERCGSSGFFNYIPLTASDWTKEFKKAKTRQGMRTPIANWWDIVLGETEPEIVPKNKTIGTHYEVEMEKYEQAKKLFLSHLPELIRDHKGEYVCAIEGQLIIGSDKDKLREKAIKQFGYHSMYLTKIGEETKKTYTYKPYLKLVVK